MGVLIARPVRSGSKLIPDKSTLVRVPLELRPAVSNPEHRLEAELEAGVKALLAVHRQRGASPSTWGGADLQRDTGSGQGRGTEGKEGGGGELSTRWDAALSHLLMPALEAYEQVGTRHEAHLLPLASCLLPLASYLLPLASCLL